MFWLQVLSTNRKQSRTCAGTCRDVGEVLVQQVSFFVQRQIEMFVFVLRKILNDVVNELSLAFQLLT